MNEKSAKAMEELYYKIKNLPYGKPEEFKVINSGLKERKSGNFFYNLITTAKNKFYGIVGRVKMWDSRILPAFYQMPLQDISREGNLEVRVSNHLFRSRLIVEDKENRLRLRVWSPKFSSLFSYLFGNFVKVKLEEY